MNELRKQGYDLEVVLRLLKERVIKARGRFNPDYLADRPSIENGGAGERLHKDAWIDSDHWSDATYVYKKQKHILRNEEEQNQYEYIYVDRKKLEIALGHAAKPSVGAPRQYDEARFYADLCVYLAKNPKHQQTHEAFCQELYHALPYLLLMGDTNKAPSMEWLKKKTAKVWKILKN